MDAKPGSDAQKDSCPSCMSCSSKVVVAFVLLIMGGLAGFFCGRHYGTRMCPVSATNTTPGLDIANGPLSQTCASPEETAKGFLGSMSRQEWDAAVKHFPRLDQRTRQIYGGLKIVSVGQSAKSPEYAGVYVPYEIILKSGETRKWKMALRNDNPAKCYVVDGGF